MRKRKRRTFTPEFKREAVQLCEVGERSIAQVAKDLDLTETALREWVRCAEIDAGKGPVGVSSELWSYTVAGGSKGNQG